MAGLAAAAAVPAQWWLEERWHVVVGHVVKTAAVCQSVGCETLTVDSQRSLRVLICCVDFLYLWQRQLNGGLKYESKRS